MTLKNLLFLSFVLLTGNAYANDAPKGYVFAELYTSQSCSSCPAADKVLESIQKNANVIALSCHVTYWDHLSWKDTLSKEFCTRRQKKHAFKITKSQRIYTPQLIVNGKKEMVGSDKPKVIEAISKAAQQPLPVINFKITADRKMYTSLPRAERGTYELILMTYKKKHTQNILSGENRGRSVTYTNSVMAMTHLGIWNGLKDDRLMTVTNKSLEGDGAVLVAQNMQTGEIAAVGKSEF